MTYPEKDNRRHAMANLQIALQTIFGNEGGFQNDSDDTGNWVRLENGKSILKGTKFGISAASYPDLDIKNLTIDEAAAIYNRDYWTPLRLYSLNSQTIATEILDTAVNCGVGTAARIWQQAINISNYPKRDIVVDGRIGPVTIEATNGHINSRILLKALNGFQFIRYLEIIATSPKMEKYAQSWLSRT
jgi:lysozyme family protein